MFSAVASFRALDFRIRLDVPVQIAGAGERGRKNAHRRTLGEGAHHAGCTDAGADIGAARDHRLNGLSRALRAGVFKHQTMFLEDAGILAERGRLVFPIVDLSDDDLERVLGRAPPMLNASGTAMPSAPTMFLSPFMRLPPIIILRYRPT